MSTPRTYATDLTDEQWALLERALPVRRGPGRPRAVDLRQICNGLRYRNRTGCQWRLLPKAYGYWGTVRYYFDKWTQDAGAPQHHLARAGAAPRRARSTPQRGRAG